MCSDSSTEEDSESETSSDSSVEENKNSRYRSTNRRKVTNVYQRNGASNRLNGFRASSAKLDPKRRLHTEANGENSGKNLVGNMTGRSVKSESGINHDIGKRRIENKSTGQKSNGLGNFVKKSEPKENVTKAERERVLRKYGLSPHPKYKAPTTVNNKTNDQTAQKNKVAIPETIYMGQKQNIDTHATQEKEPEVLNSVNSAEKVSEIDMVSEEKRVEDIPESPLPSQGEIDLNLRKDKSIVSGYFINDVNTINKEGLQSEEQTPRMTNMTVTIKKKEKHKAPSSILSGSSNLSSDSKVLKSLSDKTAQSFAKYASLSMQRRVVGHNLQTKPPSMPKRNETIQQEIGILNPRPYGFANRFKKTSTGVVPQKQSQAPVLNRSVQYSDIISINAPSTTDLPRITYRHKMTPPVNAYDARVFGVRPGVEMSSDDCDTSDDSR